MTDRTNPPPDPVATRAAARDRQDSTRRLLDLCRSFPVLQSAPGIEPWDPDLLDQWADRPSSTDEARYAATFVLALWGPWRWWRVGPFHVIRAMKVWDEQHRAAFAAWAEAPWWP